LQADGSVAFYDEGIDNVVRYSLATRRGGDVN
jgi:hypothetical protein